MPIKSKPVLTGAQVRAIRSKLGWTLMETAKKLGYRGRDPAQWLSAIESERPYTGNSVAAGRPRFLTFAQANLLLAMQEGYEPVWSMEDA